MIELYEVHSRRDMLEFIEFPNRLYAKVPQYVPALVIDELSNLSAKKNPASSSPGAMGKRSAASAASSATRPTNAGGKRRSASPAWILSKITKSLPRS